MSLLYRNGFEETKETSMENLQRAETAELNLLTVAPEWPPRQNLSVIVYAISADPVHRVSSFGMTASSVN